MTEYSLPEPVQEDPVQDKLIDIPPHEGREYQSPRTWRDLELDKKDTSPEQDLHQKESVAKHLGRLAISTETGRGERDNFITTYRWVPYSQHEATIALRRLEKHTDIAKRTKQGSGERAVEKALNSVDSFRSQAVTTIETLKEALTSLDDDDNEPSVNLIKQNPSVRTELVNYMWAKESLDGYNWHPRKTNGEPNRKTTERLKQLDGLVSQATDEELVQLWRQALVTNRLRLKFWADQVEITKDKDGSGQATRVTARSILDRSERE